MSETETLPDDQQEGLDDVEGAAGKTYQAAITLSDWTVETIIQQIRKGNIELTPSFQRREAWRLPRKSAYIESLIMAIPVPQIVLAERKEKKGSFIVIDGKQRLLTLRQFSAADADPNYKNFKLEGLVERNDLNDLSYADLQSDLLREDDRDALDNATVRTVVIRNWKDENFLYTVFLRLNTGSVQLSPQELRQALHPGPFLTFIDKYSRESDRLHEVMGISGADGRMRDAELVIRYVAFRNFISSYGGSMKSILDKTSKFYNESWAGEKPKIDKQIQNFEAAIDLAVEIFSKKEAFRKWNGARFEAALNRAVFDVMILYFSNEKIAKAAAAKKVEVLAAFKALCENSEDFRTAVEGTTKSINSIFTRLTLWAGALSDALGEVVPVPQLEDNRIKLAL
jgi:hypothetical protein